MTDMYLGMKRPPCAPTRVKLGWQPAMVYFHPDDDVVLGALVRYKEHPWEPWTRWHTALIDRMDPMPYLSKM